MNSCHCNSKSVWKRNLSLTGYSSLQWNSLCPLIIDLFHTVIILEHNYDIEIVTWKHKPSLNNYVSVFLFLDISHWFSFWDTSAVFFFSADHSVCPHLRLLFPCRACRRRIHTSGEFPGLFSLLGAATETSLTKPLFRTVSQVQMLFSSSLP